MLTTRSSTSFSSMIAQATVEPRELPPVAGGGREQNGIEDGVETRQSRLEISWYGNFGGPGHGSAEQKPIDKLDEAFKRHDEGYGKNGYFDFGTDVALIGDMLERMMNGSPRERVWAGITTGIFVGAVAPLSFEMTSTRKTLQAAEWTSEHVGGAFHAAVGTGKDVVTTASNSAGSLIGGAVSAGGDVVGAVGGLFGRLF